MYCVRTLSIPQALLVEYLPACLRQCFLMLELSFLCTYLRCTDSQISQYIGHQYAHFHCIDNQSRKADTKADYRPCKINNYFYLTHAEKSVAAEWFLNYLYSVSLHYILTTATLTLIESSSSPTISIFHGLDHHRNLWSYAK